MKRQFRPVLVLVAVAAVAVVYIILSIFGTLVAQTPNINSSFVSVTSNSCTGCSPDVPDFIYSILHNQGYSSPRVSLYFGNSDADSLISSNLIASLPSVVIPATNLSADLLDAFVYLNIFNIGSNGFVLNIPFVSGLTRNVTYYSIIQNRTVTSFDVYNASAVYSTPISSSVLNLLNPSEFLFQENSSNITSGNKTDIQIVYDSSPFSAVQSIILKSALDSFGNFTQVVTVKSKVVNISQTQSMGPVPIYDFNKMQFESVSLSLDAYNLSSVSDAAVQENLFQYDQNALSSINSVYGSFTPFVDIGGRFIEVSSMIKPTVFSGLNTTQIQSLIASNSTVNTAFENSVAFIDAALCSFQNVKAGVCNTTAVKSQEANILRQI